MYTGTRTCLQNLVSLPTGGLRICYTNNMLLNSIRALGVPFVSPGVVQQTDCMPPDIRATRFYGRTSSIEERYRPQTL